MNKVEHIVSDVLWTQSEHMFRTQLDMFVRNKYYPNNAVEKTFCFEILLTYCAKSTLLRTYLTARGTYKPQLKIKFEYSILIFTSVSKHLSDIRGCIQKSPYWPHGAKTANGIALCH
jgi:hypothetical protein